ncbi:MAG: hypothetical protein WD965_05815 [Actinomycetota bacterium]
MTRRRRLTFDEVVRALGDGRSPEADEAWSILLDEVEEDDRLDELVRRVMRWHTMGTLGDPD